MCWEKWYIHSFPLWRNRRDWNFNSAQCFYFPCWYPFNFSTHPLSAHSNFWKKKLLSTSIIDYLKKLNRNVNFPAYLLKTCVTLSILGRNLRSSISIESKWKLWNFITKIFIFPLHHFLKKRVHIVVLVRFWTGLLKWKASITATGKFYFILTLCTVEYITKFWFH